MFQSMLERALRAFTRRVGTLFDAERASLFLADELAQELVLCESEDIGGDTEVRVAIDLLIRVSNDLTLRP